jgi:hypothetical protein
MGSWSRTLSEATETIAATTAGPRPHGTATASTSSTTRCSKTNGGTFSQVHTYVSATGTMKAAAYPLARGRANALIMIESSLNLHRNCGHGGRHPESTVAARPALAFPCHGIVPRR